jgi:phosphoribosylformylglycinamidine cyclo-ligase
MSTYKDSGVDIDAGDRAVELMKASIARWHWGIRWFI